MACFINLPARFSSKPQLLDDEVKELPKKMEDDPFTFYELLP